MLIDSVNTYLSVRRRLGFKLKTVERYLTSYANFASTSGDTHVVSKTAIEWAAQASSEAARARCLGIVTRFSYFMRVEDDRHELPPDKIFCGRWHRRTPYIFTDQEVMQLILQAERLAPTGSLRPAHIQHLIRFACLNRIENFRSPFIAPGRHSVRRFGHSRNKIQKEPYCSASSDCRCGA